MQKIPGVEMYWVSIEDRVGDKSKVEEVLEGVVDQFHVFGLDSDDTKKGDGLHTQQFRKTKAFGLRNCSEFKALLGEKPADSEYGKFGCFSNF